MILLPDGKLDERRQAAGGPLAPLHESLRSELEPLLGRPPYIPEAKALLSRAGGRCELDGATLDFDPWSPHRHRCPACDRIHKGEWHDRAWITSYQLWLAERAVHAALLNGLGADARHASLARDILGGYAERYLKYPNRDNVLGPTRLFFSTYLESIWLLQICVAADLLEFAGDKTTADLARDRIVEPSSALIAEYDEGMSNRQVWNNAALFAAAALRGDSRAFDRLIDGGSGLVAHLSDALLSDGTWYEGENYHQFALRGLWYCVTLCETRGRDVPKELQDRFQRAFAAPFLTALPDFTMPSRKDSQYAVSLRQWRMAELTELGFARRRDPLLAGALARCYEPGHERRDTGRARSTADVERNGPPSSLTRADLGWRALLYALPELPELPVLGAARPRSALLEEQGLAVFRRADDLYVAIDYGQSGGGHGHPDRLNLTFAQGSTRWLDDLGTGSYVDPSLHWYRSTLAHNAPLVNGQSQPSRDGILRAHDEREGLGWVVAEVSFPDTGVRLERAVVVTPDYLIDELRWEAPRDVSVDLPWHLDAAADKGTFLPAALDGGQGMEDGFSYVCDSRATRLAANNELSLEVASDGRDLRATFIADRDVTLFSARGPGQPPSILRPFYVMRAEGREGSFRSLLAWSSNVVRARIDNQTIRIECRDGERHTHRRDEAGWHVELFAGSARSSIDLAGWRPRADARRQRPVASPAPVVLRRSKIPDAWLSELPPAERSKLLVYELGEPHYRRSEDPWSTAGSPRATLAFGASDRRLIVHAHVRAGEHHFVRADAANPYDNEYADTMGAGLQLYARLPEGSGAWMLVPEADQDRVRVRPITDWGVLIPPEARWREYKGGYEMRIELPLPDADPTGEYPIDVDLIVNETTSQRLRRRGQLVMSGAHGEFVYLRGDRHDPARLIPLVLVR
ncbi:MAG: heparinase II/III family protein [Gemmatimonadaceae bacterium]